jgi:replicative DNA helicase
VRFLDATERSLKWRLYVDDAAGLTVNGIRGKALQWDSEGGLDAVYADYLQIIKPDDKDRGNRTQEVSGIARDLKDLAKGLRKPVIAAAQINRAVEGRQDKRPTMADLRESGEIEAAADNIILLYREDYYGGEKTGETEAILAKQRNGPTGTAYVRFIAETTHYVDHVEQS